MVWKIGAVLVALACLLIGSPWETAEVRTLSPARPSGRYGIDGGAGPGGGAKRRAGIMGNPRAPRGASLRPAAAETDSPAAGQGAGPRTDPALRGFQVGAACCLAVLYLLLGATGDRPLYLASGVTALLFAVALGTGGWLRTGAACLGLLGALCVHGLVCAKPRKALLLRLLLACGLALSAFLLWWAMPPWRRALAPALQALAGAAVMAAVCVGAGGKRRENRLRLLGFFLLGACLLWNACLFQAPELRLRPEWAVLLYLTSSGLALVLDLGALAEARQSAERLSGMAARRCAHMAEQLREAAVARHDQRHHIEVLRLMAERGDYGRVDRYLSQLAAQGYRAAARAERYCDNAAADAVLGHYAAVARAGGIDWSVRADIPDRLTVQDTELCVLLGNLLENAVEACRRIPEAARWIKCTVKRLEENLDILVQNSYDGAGISRGKELWSRKRPGRQRGLGLRSVRTIARKHGGGVEFDADAVRGVFTAFVQLVDVAPPSMSGAVQRD